MKNEGHYDLALGRGVKIRRRVVQVLLAAFLVPLFAQLVGSRTGPCAIRAREGVQSDR